MVHKIRPAFRQTDGYTEEQRRFSNRFPLTPFGCSVCHTGLDVWFLWVANPHSSPKSCGHSGGPKRPDLRSTLPSDAVRRYPFFRSARLRYSSSIPDGRAGDPLSPPFHGFIALGRCNQLCERVGQVGPIGRAEKSRADPTVSLERFTVNLIARNHSNVLKKVSFQN
ncbi:hypothetical protein EVAR_87918_1 [Eumeta japonica]|uniref:Uncharacterized protein n=1 Tax=Eumeta variegata TaxID=151549 RepID=A0A4C1WXP4_EUMVA|nr:hypothetical protein EVAR_87918_1 [Eumeta japonica]